MCKEKVENKANDLCTETKTDGAAVLYCPLSFLFAILCTNFVQFGEKNPFLKFYSHSDLFVE